MNTFQIVKSKFLFLEEEYNFERIKERQTEITEFDYQFEVVHYVNDFVLIEIGGGEGLVGEYLIRVEVRRVEKGIPASYNDLVGAINLVILKKLSCKIYNNLQKIQVSNFDGLVGLVKQNISHFVTKKWYPEGLLKSLKGEISTSQNETLLRVDFLNRNFLKSKGFSLVKTDKTISAFEIIDGSFITYSNGKEELTIRYEVDVRDQYFCYHISLTGKKGEGVFVHKNTVSEITSKIKEMIKHKR